MKRQVLGPPNRVVPKSLPSLPATIARSGYAPSGLFPFAFRALKVYNTVNWPEVVILPRTIRGSVDSIDSFGNLITDITETMLDGAPRDESVRITCDEHETLGIFRTYSDQPPATLVALIGSGGRLELAIVGENAAAMLGIRTGTPVTVSW